MTGKIDSKRILERVEREGFEAVWRESASLLPKPKRRLEIRVGDEGSSHPIFDLMERMRRIFIDLGFTEVSNPIILDESEVYKQYGPEAPIILDRCYYLAVLPRPDIGLSNAKCREIERFGVELSEEKISKLQNVLRRYKKGEVQSDDLIEEFSEALEVPDVKAMRILSEVFPEFTSLRPEATTLTLRSHITTAWFPTLQSLQKRFDPPLKLFTVDVRFRREQREDATHLKVHHAASCVVMDGDVDVDLGREISEAVFEQLGLKDIRFERKKVTSKYYTPGTEFEGYVFNRGTGRWIEVVNYGLYNPIALARYDIQYPVLNVGIGIERVALVIHGGADVRRLVYPQFYMDLELSDLEIAERIRYDLTPETDEGRRIRDRIISYALKYADSTGPCEFLVYDGRLLNRHVKVYIYEGERGAKLLGAASKNQIFVYDGNVYGVPLEGMENSELVNTVRSRGVPTGLDYLGGVASLAAYRIEEAVRRGEGEVNIRVRMARSPRDVNIRISDVARRYITGARKKINIAGPVFLGVRAEIH